MRLPVYPAPEKGELLSSYVVRLADANALRPGQLTGVLGLGQFWRHDPDLSVGAQDIAVLEEATDHALRPLSLGLTFFPTATSASLPSLVVGVGHLKRTRGCPVCPSCLSKGQGLQMAWRLATSVICERHGCALIDQCPRCAAPIKHAHQGTTAPAMRQCQSCHQPFPLTNSPQGEEARRLLRLQTLVGQALSAGQVEWSGVTLSREDFLGLLHSLILLSIPDDAPQREPGQRFERLGLQTRSQVLLAVATLIDTDLVTCLWLLRERGVRSVQLCRRGNAVHGAVSEWTRHLLGFALDGQDDWALAGGKFRFTHAVWRRVMDAGADVVLAEVGWPEAQLRTHLEQWLNGNIQEWTRRTWRGTVSYFQLQRDTQWLVETPSFAGLLTTLGKQPECADALSSRGTVQFLLKHQHPDAEGWWRQMVTRRLHTLVPKNISA